MKTNDQQEDEMLEDTLKKGYDKGFEAACKRVDAVATELLTEIKPIPEAEWYEGVDDYDNGVKHAIKRVSAALIH